MLRIRCNCAGVSRLLLALPLALAAHLSRAAEPSSVAATLAADLSRSAPAVDPNIVGLAAHAFACAKASGEVGAAHTLSLIDYSRPSSEPRLWVFDLDRKTLLFNELVAHGRNSGDNVATHFSNAPGSLMSSIGAYVTADTYVGHNGYSLRLRGLEAGFNDNALERAIVMHGAAYVNPGMIHSHGRLGRSFGCPAVRPDIARQLIDTIRDGSFVFAYYPDRTWLQQSSLLGDCADRTVAAGVPAQTTIAARHTATTRVRAERRQVR
jgi:hypothetical protein